MSSKFEDREEYEKWKASQLNHTPDEPADLIQKDRIALSQAPDKETASISFPNLVLVRTVVALLVNALTKCPHCGGPIVKIFQRITRTVFWTFAILLCLFLIISGNSGMESFWQNVIDPTITEQYNQHLQRKLI